eukprot:Polyplicarium_translucidae@DN3382_c1_g1_i5.p1
MDEIIEERVLFEIPEEDVYHRDGLLQWVSPLATWKDEEIFFLYHTADRNVKIAHLEFREGEAHPVTDVFLISETFRTDHLWYFQYAIGIDEEGFIHVTGEMDNWPSGKRNYDWDFEDAECIVWRSAAPLDASAFDFRGNDATNCFPGKWWARMRYFNDNQGRLYVHYRVWATYNSGNSKVNARGLMLARYDASTETWTGLGADVPEDNGLVAWNYEFNDPNNSISHNHFPTQVFFDRDDVLHVFVMSNGEPGKSLLRTYANYAYSIDHGDTWHRSNTIRYALPMKNNMEGPRDFEVAYHTESVLNYPYGMTKLASKELVALVQDDDSPYYHLLRREDSGWTEA